MRSKYRKCQRLPLVPRLRLTARAAPTLTAFIVRSIESSLAGTIKACQWFGIKVYPARRNSRRTRTASTVFASASKSLSSNFRRLRRTLQVTKKILPVNCNRLSRDIPPLYPSVVALVLVPQRPFFNVAGFASNPMENPQGRRTGPALQIRKPRLCTAMFVVQRCGVCVESHGKTRRAGERALRYKGNETRPDKEIHAIDSGVGGCYKQ